MKKWKVLKARAQNFNTQLFVAPIVAEDGKAEEIILYATNPTILKQIVEEHNKLVSIFEAKQKGAKQA